MKKLLMVVSILFYSFTSMLHANEILRKIPWEKSSLLLGFDSKTWESEVDKLSVLDSIENSLKYFDSKKAAADYKTLNNQAFTQDDVKNSILKFKQLLLSSKSPDEFQKKVKKEFDLYKSVGDESGRVRFTGYYSAVLEGCTKRTEEYRYPIYKKPSDFNSWSSHPTRKELEGIDGLGKDSILSGNEFIWLKKRMDAYMLQIQGSGIIKLEDGNKLYIGYGGGTSYPYTSIGNEMIKDGIFPKEKLTLAAMQIYFDTYPEKMNEYISKNNRFIFFAEKKENYPVGCLGVKVNDERTIATDKTIMPPGAIAIIQTTIPVATNKGIEKKQMSKFVFDQDTGSAIKGAGRVDIFFGTGDEAKNRAGYMNDFGDLYYILLKKKI